MKAKYYITNTLKLYEAFASFNFLNHMLNILLILFPHAFLHLLNYTLYCICLKLSYLYILSISALQILSIALQAELKIIFPLHLGQHFISSQIISHLHTF